MFQRLSFGQRFCHCSRLLSSGCSASRQKRGRERERGSGCQLQQPHGSCSFSATQLLLQTRQQQQQPHSCGAGAVCGAAVSALLFLSCVGALRNTRRLASAPFYARSCLCYVVWLVVQYAQQLSCAAFELESVLFCALGRSREMAEGQHRLRLRASVSDQG